MVIENISVERANNVSTSRDNSGPHAEYQAVSGVCSKLPFILKKGGSERMSDNLMYTCEVNHV